MHRKIRIGGIVSYLWTQSGLMRLMLPATCGTLDMYTGWRSVACRYQQSQSGLHAHEGTDVGHFPALWLRGMHAMQKCREADGLNSS